MISSKYRVKKKEDDELKPEETLADSLSQLSILESPISRGVFKFVYLSIIIFSVFLVFKSFQLQIIKGQSFASIAVENNFPRYSAPSLRGIIYDANSKPLVGNVPSFDLIALHSDLPKTRSELEKIITDLGPVIGISTVELTDVFKEKENVFLFFIKKNLTKEEIAKINLIQPSGIFVLANSERFYSGGSAYSALLGYISKVNQEDMENDDYYLLTDKIGKLGLEQYYEKELRGEHRDIFLKNLDAQRGRSNNVGLMAQPGNDLYLNIDNEMQEKLYQIMTEVLNSAGLKRAAAIIQNPKTGAVLSLVSLPSFDPNIFENQTQGFDSEKITNLLEDKNNPLFNRVTSGRYSSGSTIKPLLAMAGLKEGIVTPETTIMANGSITVKSKYDPSVVYTFNDWKVHGLTNLKKAIANSVDVYFYALGGGYGNIRGLGEEKIISYFRQMLMDKKMGIDLPGEITGFVPDEKWKMETKGEEWFIGDTYNISIGQGSMGVTPLWLNTYIGSLANGGAMMKPYIVSEIKDVDGNVLKKNNPEVLTKIPFDDETMRIVKDAMRTVVLEGSAKALNDLPIAGKTGTAQLTSGPKNLNSLFTSYGPVNDPKIAMTVLVENIEHEGLSTKIAHEFYHWYFDSYQH